jgi:hypothetical protein
MILSESSPLVTCLRAEGDKEEPLTRKREHRVRDSGCATRHERWDEVDSLACVMHAMHPCTKDGREALVRPGW